MPSIVGNFLQRLLSIAKCANQRRLLLPRPASDSKQRILLRNIRSCPPSLARRTKLEGDCSFHQSSTNTPLMAVLLRVAALDTWSDKTMSAFPFSETRFGKGSGTRTLLRTRTDASGLGDVPAMWNPSRVVAGVRCRRSCPRTSNRTRHSPRSGHNVRWDSRHVRAYRGSDVPSHRRQVLPRAVADGKLLALVAGRDLFLGREESS